MGTNINKNTKLGVEGTYISSVSGGGGGYAPETIAFLSQASITDPTIGNAVNDLVLDMQSAGIWNKMIAVYPIVGGNASAHKTNLIDPNTYTAIFSGGWVHSSTGMLGNGINTFADTQLTPITDMPGPDMSMGVYMRTSPTTIKYPLAGGASQNLYWLRFTTLAVAAYMPSTGVTINIAINPQTGFTGTSKNGVDDFFILSSVGGISSTTASSPNMANTSMLIGRFGGSYTAEEFAFAFIGYHLDQTEMDTFRVMVGDFQTALSRNV